MLATAVVSVQEFFYGEDMISRASSCRNEEPGIVLQEAIVWGDIGGISEHLS